jgi:hypothetical protein
MNYLKPVGYGARGLSLCRQPNSEPHRSTSKVVHRVCEHRKQATLRHSVSCSRIGFMRGPVVARLRHGSRPRRCPQLGADRKTFARRRETGKE